MPRAEVRDGKLIIRCPTSLETDVHDGGELEAHVFRKRDPASGLGEAREQHGSASSIIEQVHLRPGQPEMTAEEVEQMIVEEGRIRRARAPGSTRSGRYLTPTCSSAFLSRDNPRSVSSELLRLPRRARSSCIFQQRLWPKRSLLLSAASQRGVVTPTQTRMAIQYCAELLSAPMIIIDPPPITGGDRVEGRFSPS